MTAGGYVCFVIFQSSTCEIQYRVQYVSERLQLTEENSAGYIQTLFIMLSVNEWHSSFWPVIYIQCEGLLCV